MNLWKQVLDRLEQTIDRTQFETWFAPTRFLAQKGDTIDVSVPSQRFVSEIRQNYAQQIRMILDEMSTDHLNLHLVADTEGNSEMNIPLGPPPSAELPLSIFNARYRFETFVVGKSNELAYAASKSVAENPGGSFNPLFIYGGAGLGKTHLIQAIGQQLREGGRSKVVYISADSFVTDFITSIRYDRMQQFRDRYRKVDALLLGDIQFMANKEQTQEELLSKDNKPITSTEIMRVVAAHYGTTVTNLKSKSNAQTVAFPRQVAMYLCKHLTDLSYPEIGRVFNNKHHSTVMYSVEKIDEKMQNDQQFGRVLEGLMKQFR